MLTPFCPCEYDNYVIFGHGRKVSYEVCNSRGGTVSKSSGDPDTKRLHLVGKSSLGKNYKFVFIS